MIMRIGAVLAAMGLACFVAFELIGSTVDENGLLHEPFALLPIGFLLLGAGILLMLPRGVRSLWSRIKGRN